MLCLTNLQHEHLISIANYLPKTQRALFASALTAPSSSWRSGGWKGKPNAASKAIVTSGDDLFDTLDFDDIIKDVRLVRRLSDDDLGAILTCIDAKNTLKKLHMSADRTTGSYADTIGNGFKPLLGSIMSE